MPQYLTLETAHRGFSAGTTFRRVATYGSWHLAAAKLEVVHGNSRIEVSEEELARLFSESTPRE